MAKVQAIRARVSAPQAACDRSQKAQREAELCIRTLIEYARKAIVYHDDETGRFVETNPAAQLLGFSLELLCEVGPIALSHPSQRDGFLLQFGNEQIPEAINGDAPVSVW